MGDPRTAHAVKFTPQWLSFGGPSPARENLSGRINSKKPEPPQVLELHHGRGAKFSLSGDDTDESLNNNSTSSETRLAPQTHNPSLSDKPELHSSKPPRWGTASASAPSSSSNTVWSTPLAPRSVTKPPTGAARVSELNRARHLVPAQPVIPKLRGGRGTKKEHTGRGGRRNQQRPYGYYKGMQPRETRSDPMLSKEYRAPKSGMTTKMHVLVSGTKNFVTLGTPMTSSSGTVPAGAKQAGSSATATSPAHSGARFTKDAPQSSLSSTGSARSINGSDSNQPSMSPSGNVKRRGTSQQPGASSKAESSSAESPKKSEAIPSISLEEEERLLLQFGWAPDEEEEELTEEEIRAFKANVGQRKPPAAKTDLTMLSSSVRIWQEKQFNAKGTEGEEGGEELDNSSEDDSD